MNRLRTCAWIETSSAATDSSHTRNSGLTASARRGRQEPDREPTQRRFAAAGLADEADDLTFADGEIDAVDGMHHFLAQARPEDVGDPCGEVERPDELSRDGLELEQRHRHGQGCSPPATARSAMATYACSTAAANRAASTRGEARTRSRSVLRNVASRGRSCASAVALATYPSAVS